MNDEPLLSPATSDCTLGRGATGSRSDDVCVAVPDLDRDGCRDVNDDCLFTAKGADVDEQGCSLAQFCGTVNATTRDGELACKAADWKDDEGSAPADCTVGNGSSPGRSDDVCVPAP